MEAESTLKRALHTEALIFGRKKSTWIVTFFLLLLTVYAVYIAKSEIGYQIELGNQEVLEQSTFPPIWNGILFFTAMFGGTIYILFGLFDSISEGRMGCTMQRVTTTEIKDLVLGRTLVVAIQGIMNFMVVSIIGIFAQTLLWKGQGSFWSWEVIAVGIGKLVTIVVLLVSSYIVGSIIGQYAKNTAIGVILCLVFDQAVLANSYLYKGFLYRAFEESNFLVVPATNTCFPFEWFVIIPLLVLNIVIFLFSYMFLYKRKFK